MTQIIPYILPLMLGRTFDLNKMSVGVDIFPKEAIDNRTFYDYGYININPNTLVDSAERARDLLDDVDNAISLKVKTGIASAGPSVKYLADPIDRQNTVEIVFKSTFESAKESLPFNVVPIPNWKMHGEALGTHYAQSLTYGGDIIVSIRLKTKDYYTKDQIKTPIIYRVLELGDMEENKFTRDILKSVESTEIKIFSSGAFTEFPTDVKSLRKLLKFIERKDPPIKVELSPLKVLDSTRKDKLENRLSRVNLDEFEDIFDTMLETKTAFSELMKSLVKPLTEEQEQKVGDFYNSLENSLRVFYEVIDELDASKGPEQLNKAYNALDAELEEEYNRYFYNKFRQLQYELKNLIN